jgi:hypothetical protein
VGGGILTYIHSYLIPHVATVPCFCVCLQQVKCADSKCVRLSKMECVECRTNLCLIHDGECHRAPHRASHQRTVVAVDDPGVRTHPGGYVFDDDDVSRPVGSTPASVLG